MAAAVQRLRNQRLPPEVNRILFVRNLPFNITSEELYDIFGKYGPIRQVRVGCAKDTRGTAYVVFDDIYDAKQACDHLSGFNVANRYLIVLYYNPKKHNVKGAFDQDDDDEALQPKVGKPYEKSGGDLLVDTRAKASTKDLEDQVRTMQQRHGVDGDQHARK